MQDVFALEIEGEKADEEAVDSFFIGLLRWWRTKIIATGGQLKKGKRQKKAIVVLQECP